ncbi:MAG: hypothetical protein MJE12_17100, partial [Alphaproteobacteria bacterium]|nr:hypothetical protein [Alphaproteobacteria bacterium]
RTACRPKGRRRRALRRDDRWTPMKIDHECRASEEPFSALHQQVVIAGLDPAIQAALASGAVLDHRVKPGDDEREVLSLSTLTN